MIQKSILTSKTFWVQVLTVLSALVPAVQSWIAANPVEFVAALGAINVLVRFATSGKVTVFGDSSAAASSDKLGLLVGFVTIGTAVVATLPSCSPAQLDAARGIPVRACVITEQGRLCYSPKGGLSAEIDATK